jgi:replicative DNA helicase
MEETIYDDSNNSNGMNESNQAEQFEQSMHDLDIGSSNHEQPQTQTTTQQPTFSGAKVPPNSNQSEQSVIGGLLIYNDVWDDINTLIGADDFYHTTNKIIFEVIQFLLNNNSPADILTVKEQLAKNGDEERIGGFAYLASIAESTPSVENIKNYADHVRELAVYRRLISVSNEIASDAYQPKNLRVEEVIDRAESKIFTIAGEIAKSQTTLSHIKERLPSFVEDINTRAENNGVFGLETGFSELDKMTTGLQKGDLVIVAGRPSMGKTAFSMNIVEHVAIQSGLPVLVFSLEMPTEQLMMRMVSSSFKINMRKMQEGSMDANDWGNFNHAVQVLEKSNIIIDESVSPSPTEIRSKARRVYKNHPDLALIVVDYLGLMQVPGANDRNSEVAEISRGLKGLAKELNVPVIALSQLNRSVEGRPIASKGRMPQMSDLRDSGSIEQDADIIAFMYRDEAYHSETFSNPDEVGKADLKIAKHRNGSTGFIKLQFNGEFAKFENLAQGFNEYDESQMQNSYADDMTNVGDFGNDASDNGDEFEYSKPNNIDEPF